MFHLTVQNSEEEGTEYWLTRPVITLGRGKGNDIVLDGGPDVAENHARLSLTESGDAYRIEALETVFGTYVNGQQIRSGVLEDGDRIRFGKVEAILAQKADGSSSITIGPDGPDGPDGGEGVEAHGAVLQKFQEAQAHLESRDREIETLRQKLAEQEALASRAQAELDATRAGMGKTQSEFEAFKVQAQSELDAYAEQMSQEAEGLRTAVLDAEEKERQAVGAMTDLQQRVEAAEKRLADLDTSSRKRIQRGHDTISALRKKAAQQESEIRELRYEVMKLRRAKEASDTLLESMKRCYTRDKKQHNRLVEQFRDRARQESLRAESAMHQLAKAQATAESDG